MVFVHYLRNLCHQGHKDFLLFSRSLLVLTFIFSLCHLELFCVCDVRAVLLFILIGIQVFSAPFIESTGFPLNYLGSFVANQHVGCLSTHPWMDHVFFNLF